MWSSDYIIISLIKIIMDNNENTMPEGEMPEVNLGAEAPATDAPSAPEEETPAM